MAFVTSTRCRAGLSVSSGARSPTPGQRPRGRRAAGPTCQAAPAGGAASAAPPPPPLLATTDVGASTNVRWHEALVSRNSKELLLGQQGVVLFFTGEAGWVEGGGGRVSGASASKGGGAPQQHHTPPPPPHPTTTPPPPPHTGLSASGKSTVATHLEHLLHARGHLTALLDGDNIRHGLNSNLGFR